jgi:hypothetical protein
MTVRDDAFNDLLHFMTADPTAGALPEGEAENAKNRIGHTIANIVVAQTAASIIAANAEAILIASKGDQSIAARCQSFKADCESKLTRITEGWDANPTDTQFATSRAALVTALTHARDTAEKIRDISDGLLHIFDTDQEEATP